MSARGALIFAYNNESIDYQRLAEFNATLIERNLGIPTTIITGIPETQNQRTFRYHDNTIEKVSWHNHDRMTAYDVSPYDETLLLDADYLILSKNLSFVWDVDTDFMCADSVYDVTGLDTFHAERMLSKYSFPMRWATCVFFRKCLFAKSVFDMMEVVRDNYEFYQRLFNFRDNMYRNDYALSIALQLLSGYTDRNFHLPYPLATLTTSATIKFTGHNPDVVIDYPKAEGVTGRTRVSGLDLHVMNKKQLGTLVNTL